jgi:uncharacterized HAD superfamily protein
MTQKVAIIDIDDTIADMRTPICSMLNSMMNTSLSWNEWYTLDVQKLYGISRGDFLTALRDNEIIEKMVPHHNTLKFMEELKNAGYFISLLTARGWHNNGTHVTKQWLNEYNIPFDELIVCGITEDKSDIVSKHYKHIEFTVDDSLSHCRNYVLNDKIKDVFVYDMPWNRRDDIEDSRAIRVDCLEQIQKELQRKYNDK